ncbi:hypothetical protein JHL22_05185 [Advenella sp. WQ 585]|uniref:Uncharacterized protein n=1 Tax=Advenella mandrilli TaxID=2800330 RepID=A0ABS1EC64_9BURK|nr:hypothetical protein [Advenella mandrilli]MBK1780605.1 hypothetical protein [Advenella mandrilli]
MNFDKANEWRKQNFPHLEGYEIRAYTFDLCFSATQRDEDAEFRPAPLGYIYAIARVRLYDDTWGDDVVLLMPENL